MYIRTYLLPVYQLIHSVYCTCTYVHLWPCFTVLLPVYQVIQCVVVHLCLLPRLSRFQQSEALWCQLQSPAQVMSASQVLWKDGSVQRSEGLHWCQPGSVLLWVTRKCVLMGHQEVCYCGSPGSVFLWVTRKCCRGVTRKCAIMGNQEECYYG